MFIDKALQENNERYKERLRLYQHFGYDMKKENRFIMEKTLPLARNILEVGTGKGYFTMELAQTGHRFTSLDISKIEQEYARLNICYLGLEDLVDFHLADAAQLPYATASYDIIVSVNTIHHLSLPFKVADEMARVVTKEGKLILSDFNLEGLTVLDKMHAHEGRKHETGLFRLNDLKLYFQKKKFSVEEHRSQHQEMIVAHKC